MKKLLIYLLFLTFSGMVSCSTEKDDFNSFNEISPSYDDPEGPESIFRWFYNPRTTQFMCETPGKNCSDPIIVTPNKVAEIDDAIDEGIEATADYFSNTSNLTGSLAVLLQAENSEVLVKLQSGDYLLTKFVDSSDSNVISYEGTFEDDIFSIQVRLDEE